MAVVVGGCGGGSEESAFTKAETARVEKAINGLSDVTGQVDSELESRRVYARASNDVAPLIDRYQRASPADRQVLVPKIAEAAPELTKVDEFTGEDAGLDPAALRRFAASLKKVRRDATQGVGIGQVAPAYTSKAVARARALSRALGDRGLNEEIPLQGDEFFQETVKSVLDTALEDASYWPSAVAELKRKRAQLTADLRGVEA